MTKDTILITGSSGAIGKSLAELLSESYDIVTCDRSDCDLTDAIGFEHFVRGLTPVPGDFHLIHCAAHSGFREMDNHEDSEVIANNLKMHASVMDARHYFDRVFYFGSGAEFPNTEINQVSEMMNVVDGVPRTSYGFAKWFISKTLQRTDHETWLRPFGVFGPYEREKGFFKNNITRALKGEPLEVHSSATVDFISVYDIANVIDQIIRDDLVVDIINLVYKDKHTLYDLASMIRMAVPGCTEIENHEQPPRNYSAFSRQMDNFKLLGLQKSIERMVEELS